MSDMTYTVADVLRGCAEIRVKLAPLADKGYIGYALTYLDAMPQAFDEYGIDGMRTQALYVLNNLAAWKGVDARIAKGWLKSIAKPGIIKD